MHQADVWRFFVFKHYMCSYHGCLNLPNIYKGPQPLFCIWVGLGIHPPAGFPKKKAGKLPGGSGGKAPRRFFPPFLCGKKGGASRHKRKEKRLFSMSAHNVRNPAERGVECAATFFWPEPQKKAKGLPRVPPEPPGPQALSVYRPIQVAALLPVFLKRKPAGHPGLQGGSPLARLCLLSSCEERRWPSGQT